MFVPKNSRRQKHQSILLFRRKQKSISNEIRTYLFPKESHSSFHFCSSALRDHCRFKKCQVFKSKQDLLKMHRCPLVLLSERSFGLGRLTTRAVQSCSIKKKTRSFATLQPETAGIPFQYTGNATSGNDGRVAETCALVTQYSILFYLIG